MLARRDLLTAGLLGKLIGAAHPAASPAQFSDRAASDIAAAIKEIGGVIDAPWSFHELIGIRQRMTEFLHAQMKFPDFLDVGSDVWVGVYDWHVKHGQPLNVSRDVAGRYTLAFMQTTLVLRADAVANFIGTPYDKS